MMSVHTYCRLSLMFGCAGYLLLSLYIMQGGYLDTQPAHKGSSRGRHRTSHRQKKEELKTSNSSNAFVNKWESYIRRNAFSTLGHKRTKKGYLTIGIPSIWRVNGMDYLLQTLDSLINTTSMEDKANISVIVFLADTDLQYNQQTAEIIAEKYKQHLADGFIRVIWLPEGLDVHFYPPFEGLRRNFNDKRPRVKWRAKQAVDYAFMFFISRELSMYYLQLEDDVICSPGFLSKIQKFIKHTRKRWAVLDFSELGFIGKLVHSRNLDRLTNFVLAFYDQQPIDWLLKVFMSAMAQRDRIICKPTLFQHVGRRSSFDSVHPNNLVDEFFELQ